MRTHRRHCIAISRHREVPALAQTSTCAEPDDFRSSLEIKLCAITDIIAILINADLNRAFTKT